MMSLRPASAWPRRVTYPLAGLAIGAGAPLAYLILWHVVTAHRDSLVGSMQEIATHGADWVALTLPGIAVLVVVGWVFGRRHDDLVARSVTDSLTDLPNLAGHRAHFAKELARAARQATPLSLLLVDVDGLKAINDVHGHAAGDAAIRLVAESLRSSCRVTDHAARIGGDEFAVLAPGARAREGVMLGERIRAALRGLAQTNAGATADMTVSIGVADLDTVHSLDAEELRAAADRALYRAKADGRDRVIGPGSGQARTSAVLPRLRAAV